MKWLKSAIVGALGSLLMFLLLMFAIHGSGIAPINLPPSAAFLEQLGLNAGPIPLLVHFVYGATWSMVLVAAYGADVNVRRGLILATALWLFLMIVYSPIIGWGVFGFGASARTLAPNDPLYLGSPVKYLLATLALHVIYGLIIGWLNPIWIEVDAPSRTTA